MKASANVAAILMIFSITPSHASETTRYIYDAHGRLVRVERSGSVNNGVTTEYAIDKSDNRKRVITTGAASGTPPA